ncbi:hypothetical protein [Streptomyces sp. NPDC048188]|uniref:hypothetical protein n=1 Tax=Streptomyces sp. NPDC048188 TaxID=3155749 RepID=UPI00341F3373
MPQSTSTPPPEPSPAQQPRPNPIFRQPATVEACQADYAAGAAIRQAMARQESRRR